MTVFGLKLKNASTFIAIAIVALTLCACGGGSAIELDSPQSNPEWSESTWEQGVKSGSYSVLAVDSLGQSDEPTTGLLGLSVAGSAGAETVAVSTTDASASTSWYLHLQYDPRVTHPVSVSAADGIADQVLTIGITQVPGVVHIGLASIGGKALSAGVTELATVEFADGPFTGNKNVSTVAATRVDDLRFGFTDHEMLTWGYRSTGDYDQNSEVNIADITPIAIFFQVRSGDVEWPAALVADGDKNTEVNLADITPIAMNFLSRITDYLIKAGPTEFGPFGLITDGAVEQTEGVTPPLGGYLRYEEVLANPVENAYYCVVAADGAEEAGGISNIIQYTGQAPAANPPQNLAVMTLLDVFHLEWDAPTGSVPGSYDVHIASTQGLLASTPPIASGVTTTTYVLPSYVTPDNELYLGVKANYGGILSELSNIVHHTPGGGGDDPPVWGIAGTGINSAIPGDTQVAIEWFEATEAVNPPVEYLLFYAESTTGIDWETHQDTDSDGLSKVVGGLTNGTSYDFGVRARNNIGATTNNTNFLSATPTEGGGVPIDSGVWQASELVDDGGDPVAHDVGRNSDVEVANDGTIHIAHYNFSTLDLMYTYGTPGNWTTEVITREGDTGLWPDLELHPVDGHPCIAYHNGDEASLEYAQFNGTSWDIETVDSGGDRGAFASLAFDPADDYPAIAYYDDVGQDCRYAKWTGSDWDTEIVFNGSPDGFELTGSFTSLAFNPQTGNPGISFMRTYNPGGLDMFALWYAEYSGSSWSSEEADLGALGDLELGTCGYGSSICYSPAGVPHMLHGDISGEVRLTHKSGGFWQTSMVGTTSFMPGAEADRFDTDIEWFGDAPYWVYYDTEARSLYYGTGLNTGTVVESGNIGGTPALDIEADGTVHLSYADVSNQDLRYAVKGGVVWTTEIADPGDNREPFVGERPSLDFEPTSGYPMISYYDVSGRGLKYADKEGGGWRKETVSSGSFDGAYNSMGVDETGETYIAYFTINTSTGVGGLHVAKGFFGNWDMTTIQTGDGEGGDVVGQYLALDMNSSPDNFPGISYYNKSSKRMEFALGGSGDSYEQTAVDGFNNAGRWSSTAFNPANKLPGIAYYRRDTGDLFFSERAGGGAWTPEPVDTVQDVGNRCAMTYVTDYIATVEPWISYYDATNNKLKVAYDDGSGWQFVDVPAPGGSADYGSYSTIANHPVHARPAVVFFDKDNGKLWYMFIGDPDNPQAAVEIAGADHLEGTFPSLVFNPLTDQPGVAFQDGTNGDLRYVWREGS